MYAPTLSQPFINAIHMQMLQHSSKLIQKNNYLLNSFQFIKDIINQNEQKNYWRYSMDNYTYISSYIYSSYMPK